MSEVRQWIALPPFRAAPRRFLCVREKPDRVRGYGDQG